MSTLGKMSIVGIGFLFAVSDAAAQSITWGQGSQAVPMSATAMAGMAGLFLLLGAWMLMKSKKYSANMFVVAAMAAGASSLYVSDLNAFVGNTYSITTSSGTYHMEQEGYWEFDNDSGAKVQILSIDMPVGTFVNSDSTTCMVGLELENGDSCVLDWGWET